jgi:serine palmitoyltransferase
LKQVVELADKYKFRVLLEETGSFGVLGKTGRGCLEHWGMKATDVSLICASMSSTLATVGGFCVSDHAIVSHQRLSSASYCFSASLPPFNATAALEAIR